MKQYIGARYVPIIFQNPDDYSNSWKSEYAYEPLTIVSYGGASYTSKKAVPASVGNPASNPEYWVAIGLYSGQTTKNTNSIVGIKNGITPYKEEGNPPVASQNYPENTFVWVNDDLCQTTRAITTGETLVEDGNITVYNMLPYDIDLDDINLPEQFQQKEYFRNKRIMIMGDSISDENTYPPNWVTQFRNFVSDVGATVINKSVSGITLTGASGMATTSAGFTETDIDIILVQLGTNDCNIQAIIGNNQTLDDITTVTGAMNALRNVIVSKWLNAQVFFLIPPKCALTESTSPAIAVQRAPRCIYRHVLAIWANQFNWNLIDLGAGMPQFDLTNPVIKSTYSDGIHPNVAYAPRMMKYIVQQIIAGGTTEIGFEQTKINWTNFITSSNFSDGYAEINFDSKGNIHIFMTATALYTGTRTILGLPPVVRQLFTPGYTSWGFVNGSDCRILLFPQDLTSVQCQCDEGANVKIDYTFNIDERVGYTTVVSQ